AIDQETCLFAAASQDRLFQNFALQPSFPLLWRYTKGRSCEPLSGVLRYLSRCFFLSLGAAMRRRSRAGGEPGKAQRRKTGTHKSPITPKAVRPRSSSTAREETKVARLTRERDEALEQQAAASEVLRVISSSPADLQPVFEAMLDNAVRICDALVGGICRWDGHALHHVAVKSQKPAFAELLIRTPIHPNPNTNVGRMLVTKREVHVPDLAAHPAYIEQREPGVVAAVEIGRVRTALYVPMLKESGLIGAILLARGEVRPFTDKQIGLAKNFAAQAVIAIENARLLNELRQRTMDLTERTADLAEALEQQTATSEVLEVISSSPGELDLVFGAMLDKAVRICEARFGNLYLRKGDGFRAAAMHNAPSAYAESRTGIVHPSPNSTLWQAAQTKQPA